MLIIPERVYERVIRWADRDETTGCLVSRYSVGSHGYSQVGWSHDDGRTVTLCHRAVWQYLHGPIPDGYTVDHEVCRNRQCCEATHLRLITNLDNARRNKAGRDWPIGNGECIRGHGSEHWRERGTVRKKGYCLLCKRDNITKYLDRKRRGLV